jgi:hypothetical protein
MECCEATDKPDGNEAVYNEKIRYIIMRECFQNTTLGKIDPREHKDI